jgi:uncharacterized damage-inducible protein DinB
VAEAERIALPETGELHPRIALLFSQMQDIQADLKKYAAGWSQEDLEREIVPGFMTPGRLLAHVAEAETWWVQVLLAGRGAGEDGHHSPPGWCAPFAEDADGDAVAEGQPLETYFELLDRVRRETHAVLKGMDAEDLSRDFPFTSREGKPYAFSLEWVLHHLCEHEAHHRGQLALMKRMAGV